MTHLTDTSVFALAASLFPAPAVASTPAIRTFEDVERYLIANGPTYLLQALRTLQSHCRMAPLSALAADLGWFLGEFPKSSRQNPMPRPDLGQGLAAYKKWHADVRRALALAVGERVAKAERDARADGWTDLQAAIEAQTEDGGLIHPGSAGPVKRLADLGRRQGFEPWDLANPEVVEKIEDGLAHHTQRTPIRSAISLLGGHRFIPEIGALLPPADQPLVVLPTKRDLSRLPDHVDAVVRELVAAASLSIDPTNGKARPRVSQDTIDGYLAAMRYHLRTLRRCVPEPEFGYAPPADLAAVNDVVGLFGVDHIRATLRWTERHDHLPEAIEARSAYTYYKAVERILTLAGALPEGLPAVLKGSHYMQDARALCEGMTPETQVWCEALVTGSANERAFHAMHRTLMRKADPRARRGAGGGMKGVSDMATTMGWSGPSLWTPGDWNALFGFGTNILVNLLVLTGLLQFVLQMPTDIIFGRILPALGLMMFLSTAYYAWLAYDYAKKTGRDDVCALPSGISVPHMFVVTFVIMLPIATVTGDPIKGWEAGLVWVFFQSFILMIGGFVAPYIRHVTPWAALLGTLAGVSIAFISMRPALEMFMTPVIGVVCLAIILAAWFGGVPYPRGIPAGLVAIAFGMLVAWGSAALGLGIGGMSLGGLTAALSRTSASPCRCRRSTTCSTASSTSG